MAQQEARVTRTVQELYDDIRRMIGSKSFESAKSRGVEALMGRVVTFLTSDVATALHDLFVHQFSVAREVGERMSAYEKIARRIEEALESLNERVDNVETHPLLVIAESNDLNDTSVLVSHLEDILTLIKVLDGTELASTATEEEGGKVQDIVDRVRDIVTVQKAVLELTIDQGEEDEDEENEDNEGDEAEEEIHPTDDDQEGTEATTTNEGGNEEKENSGRDESGRD